MPVAANDIKSNPQYRAGLIALTRCLWQLIISSLKLQR